MNVSLTHIGTAALLLEIGSLRLLTDPVFDPAGGRYSFGYGTGGTKLTDPAIKPEAIGRIDAVLLSHDHHQDNLDRAGRALLPKVRQVITTQAGAKRLGGNALGLKPWQSTTLESNGFQIKVTAMPAQHGSLFSHLIVGETTGFLLEWDGQQHGALYISGDTVWFNGIHEIARRYKISAAILHIGSAGFRITGPIRFTLNAMDAVRIVRALNPLRAIPIHHEGWSHFREPREKADSVFKEAGITDRIQWLSLGTPVELSL
jgi:L-ascorbate metabolism protein UlaG (beta-lactamase superfamily)